MRKITISGGFHNSGSISLNGKNVDGRLYLSVGQVKKLRSHMCGIKNCSCTSGLLGWDIDGAKKDELMDAMTNAEVEEWTSK